MQNMSVKNQVDNSDIKAKAKALRSIIQDIASKSGMHADGVCTLLTNTAFRRVKGDIL